MKKLKRLPSGLSYAEIRARRDGTTQRTADMVKDMAGQNTVPDTGQAKPSDRQPEGPETPRDRQDVTEPERIEGGHGPITVTAHVGHVPTPGLGAAAPVATLPVAVDASRERGGAVSPPGIGDPGSGRQVGTAHRMGAPSRGAKRQQSGEPADTGREGQVETVVIRGHVARPATGVSPTYDEVARRYGDKVAMTYLLDASLKTFAEALAAGEVATRDAEPAYPAHPKKHQPTRSFPRDAYAAALKHIDPMGILRPGTIGTNLMQTAINRFFASEQTREK